MKCSIFYSWESDLPNKDNRSFIENCIKKAIKKKKLGLEIGVSVAVDRDTKETIGTPDIVGTIFDKIARADIFICDISIINGEFKGRKCPNPNVLLELGYAVRTLGWERIICFYNLKYGDIENVPFDLSHRRLFFYNSDNENEKEFVSKAKLEECGKDIEIDQSKSYENAKAAFDILSTTEKNNFILAAKVASNLLFPLEPRLTNEEGILLLSINSDSAAIGVDGDVRDVLCIRSDSEWEIGLSCKHNHEALKHPRITEEKDFGRDWVGYNCSDQFIQEMTAVINPLIEAGQNGLMWKNIPDKMDKFYVPILQAYLNELTYMCNTYEDVPGKLLSYFFGAKDFYKVIAKKASKTTTIEGFNMHGTLNAPSGKTRAMMRVSRIRMPKRLIEARFKNRSKTTIILTFDEGWTVSMRLHNKDKIAKPTSLAWDVQLVGLPTGTYINTHSWFE